MQAAMVLPYSKNVNNQDWPLQGIFLLANMPHAGYPLQKNLVFGLKLKVPEPLTSAKEGHFYAIKKSI